MVFSIISNAFSPEIIGQICETSDNLTATSSIRPPSFLCQSSNSMSSSISGFPPVAKLCSNCQKAQFRDDVPQLFQDGSRLEFDKEQVPPHWRRHSWGVIPTEFEFMDSFPELPKLVKSGRDGCDFCCFLHGAITLAASEQQDISTAGRARIIFVHISYVWGPPQEESISSDQSLSSGESLSSGRSLSEWPIGLHAMRIDFEVSSDENSSESIFTLDCAVQSLCGEYTRSLAQHECMHSSTCIRLFLIIA